MFRSVKVIAVAIITNRLISTDTNSILWEWPRLFKSWKPLMYIKRTDFETVLSNHFPSIPVMYQGRHTESSEHRAAEESHLSSLLGCQLLCLCLNDSLSCPERAHLSILSLTEPSLPSGLIILREKVNGAIYNWPQICFGADFFFFFFFFFFFSIMKHSKMSTICAPAIIFAY